MKTIIKIPIYLELTTPEQSDRKVITNATRSVLQPAIIRILKDFLPQYIYESELRELKRSVGNSCRFRITTESEVLKVGTWDPLSDEALKLRK